MIGGSPAHQPIATVKLRGRDVVKISVVRERADDLSSRLNSRKGRILTAWLDPARDYAPVEIEEVSLHYGYVHWAVRDIRHRKAGDVWLPVSGEIEPRYFAGMEPPEGMTRQQLEDLLKDTTDRERLALWKRCKFISKPFVALAKIVVDSMDLTSVDASVFEVDLPAGTKVTDTILDAIYTEGNEQGKMRALEEGRSRLSIIGKPAPPILATKWLQGEQIHPDKPTGKVVIVHFFAVGCPYCRRDYAGIQAMHKGRAKKGLAVVGIHPPCRDQAEEDALQRLIRRHKLDYPIAVDASSGKEGWGKTFDAYKIDAIPHTVLIDRDGTVSAREGRPDQIIGKADILLEQR